MAFIKRAAATGLAFLLVTGVLVGAHRLARLFHRPPATAPQFKSPVEDLWVAVAGEQRFSDVADPIGDLRPLTAKDPHGSSEAGPFLAVSAQTAAADDQLDGPELSNAIRTADGEATPPLLPLPRTSAAPLPAQGPDESTTAKAAPQESADKPSAGRRIIEKELPDSSAEERELWHEMLKDLPPNDLRELLRVREKLNRLPRSALSIRPPLGQPALLPHDLRSAERGLSHPFSIDGRLPASKADSPEHTIREALAVIAQARQIIVSNLANANTPGYKRRIVSFATVLDAPSFFQEGRPNAVGLESACRLGVAMVPPQIDMSQGKIRRTGRSLDLAIDGAGFFQVECTEDKSLGTCYTRCGRFVLNRHGHIVLRGLKQEWIVTPRVTVPKRVSKIGIGTDGVVSVTNGPDPESVEERSQIGMIQIASFRSDWVLTPCGDNVLFERVDKYRGEVIGNPGRANLGRLRQGCFEESNVDPKQELAELQKLQQHAQILEQAARLLHLEDCAHPGLADRPTKPDAP